VVSIGRVENNENSVINASQNITESNPPSGPSIRFNKELDRALSHYFLYKFGIKLDRPKLALVKFLVLNRFEFGANLSCLARVLQNVSEIYGRVRMDHLGHEHFYHQAYRLARKLHELEMVNLIVHEGRLHVVPTQRLIDLAVDLIISLAKFKPFSGSRRVSEERREAFALLGWHHSLKYDDWLQLFELLERYRLRTAKQVLLFRRVDEDRYLLLHFKHRFEKRELKKRLEDFDKAWANASANYNVGLFITLTMDPKSYSNLVEACVLMERGFNRFRSFILSRYGKVARYRKEVEACRECAYASDCMRLAGLRRKRRFRDERRRLEEELKGKCRKLVKPIAFVKAPESQDSGNPHLHVVVFGLSRIEDHFKLTEILKKHGFGEVHFEYQIKRTNEGRWVWANARKRPKDARTNDVHDYLRKYLVKAFSVGLKGSWDEALDLKDFKISWYFGLNKRFFTCSRVLLSKVNKRNPRTWIFIGVYYYDCLPKFVERYLFLEGYEIVFDGETWSLKVIDSCATPSLEYL